MKEPVIFLIGPTGSGKTEVSVMLAERINAEIICCDSMQVYRGFDIMTSKPSAALEKKIPHHLFDIKDPDQDFSVAEFREQALEVIKKVHKKGKVPLFVGGTGLYVTALVDGLFKAPGANWQLRSQLLEDAKQSGNEALFERLKKADPDTAAMLHPNDLRRIIRALEIWYITGSKMSELKRSTTGIASEYDIKLLGLNIDRQRLYERINDRAEEMFANGVIDEVRAVRKKWDLSLTSAQALGCKEIIGLLDGDYALDEAKDLLKRNTRRYAKRQLSWFRRDDRIRWVEAKEAEAPGSLADKLIAEISTS